MSCWRASSSPSRLRRSRRTISSFLIVFRCAVLMPLISTLPCIVQILQSPVLLSVLHSISQDGNLIRRAFTNPTAAFDETRQDFGRFDKLRFKGFTIRMIHARIGKTYSLKSGTERPTRMQNQGKVRAYSARLPCHAVMPCRSRGKAFLCFRTAPDRRNHDNDRTFRCAGL